MIRAFLVPYTSVSALAPGTKFYSELTYESDHSNRDAAQPEYRTRLIAAVAAAAVKCSEGPLQPGPGSKGELMAHLWHWAVLA